MCTSASTPRLIGSRTMVATRSAVSITRGPLRSVGFGVCLVVGLLLAALWGTVSGQQSLQRPPTDGNARLLDSEQTDPRQRDTITLACVVCHDRLQEALTMLKSAILMTHSPLRVLAFVDPELSARLKLGLDALARAGAVPVEYRLLPPSFPEGDAHKWRQLFAPCSTQRLFLPELLVEEDAVIYADTDTLFLSPTEQVWAQFGRMNASQLAAMAPENVGHGATYAVKHPYSGQGGMNAGVLLMNLTRMRAVKFSQLAVKVNAEFWDTLIFADQGILNIIFHFHPNWLLAMPCRFNFKFRQCELGCASAEKSGIAILHGHVHSFHSGEFPGFVAVYSAFRTFQLGSDPFVNLVVPMRRNLESVKGLPCGSDRTIGVFMESVTGHLIKHRS